MKQLVQEYYYRRIVDAHYYLKYRLNEPIVASSWVEKFIYWLEKRDILYCVKVGYRHFEHIESYLYYDTLDFLNSAEKVESVKVWAADYHGQLIDDIVFYDAVLYLAYLGEIPPHNYRYVDAPAVSAVGFSTKEWEAAVSKSKKHYRL